MNRLLRLAAISALVLSILPAMVKAEVSRLEGASLAQSAGGPSFGSTGPYERVTGKIYFLIDPANKRNQVIADLDKAPRNAAGKVELSADIVILKPRDASKGNGIAIFDIVNRGA